MLLNETALCPTCKEELSTAPVWCEKCKLSYCSQCIKHGHNKPSDYQLFIIRTMLTAQDGLRNTYNGPGAPFRPANGMFSGLLYGQHKYGTSPIHVSYRTIAAMQRGGWIVETNRVTGEAFSGSTKIETATIYYGLTEEARLLVTKENHADRNHPI